MLQSKARLLELNTKLAENLTSKGVEATADETTTSLVNKITDIATIIGDNTPEFLKEITLTDDVSAITVDLSDYTDKYYIFLIYPDLQFSTSEWLYIFPTNSKYVGYYKQSTSISINDSISNTAVLIYSNQGTLIFTYKDNSILLGYANGLSSKLTCHLYNAINKILSNSSLKIYGVKGDILNVDL
ncbi:hypothetical protein [uncultured Ruminococcus sp.]|uniref:hypothetical protein n=1 Tax=uncultured Ruminococcus sp. TaxID=165186 RepID=UPI00260100C6|nr:hypothetical protein [uncultured Ruminococcus sp.]